MAKIASTEKWIISAWSVLAVLLIFNPLTYYATNYIFTLLGAPTIQNDPGPLEFSAPTIFGFVLHLVVFLLLTRGMMELPLPM